MGASVARGAVPRPRGTARRAGAELFMLLPVALIELFIVAFGRFDAPVSDDGAWLLVAIVSTPFAVAGAWAGARISGDTRVRTAARWGATVPLFACFVVFPLITISLGLSPLPFALLVAPFDLQPLAGTLLASVTYLLLVVLYMVRGWRVILAGCAVCALAGVVLRFATRDAYRLRVGLITAALVLLVLPTWAALSDCYRVAGQALEPSLGRYAHWLVPGMYDADPRGVYLGARRYGRFTAHAGAVLVALAAARLWLSRGKQRGLAFVAFVLPAVANVAAWAFEPGARWGGWAWVMFVAYFAPQLLVDLRDVPVRAGGALARCAAALVVLAWPLLAAGFCSVVAWFLQPRGMSVRAAWWQALHGPHDAPAAVALAASIVTATLLFCGRGIFAHTAAGLLGVVGLAAAGSLQLLSFALPAREQPGLSVPAAVAALVYGFVLWASVRAPASGALISHGRRAW